MSDEEKKAIEKLRKEIDNIKISILGFERDIDDKDWLKKVTGELKNDISAREIILNLIEKQSKEIEELKTINQMQKYRIEVIDERELISKDIIKEILGIEENIDNEKLLSLLQTIVDENARLEDIEDRKVQIEYNNVFNKGVKSVEDKIKAKIEEVDIQLQKLKDGLTGRKTNFVNKNMLFAQKKVLQSLLEKE